MKTTISEETKERLLALAGALNDEVNDIHRQVRTGEVWTHNLETWLAIEKILYE